jgi:FkbM family methyltransferase
MAVRRGSGLFDSILLYVDGEAKKVAKIGKREGAKGIFSRLLRYGLKAPRLWRDEILWLWKIWRSKGGDITAIVNGKIMFLNPLDHGISKELFIYRTHEPLATNILTGLLKEGMTVVDIGANIGYYVFLESDAVGPNGKVVAIEPDPDNAELLTKNVEANGLGNVEIIRAAIGDADGTGKLYKSGSANWHSLLPSYYVDEEDAIDVRVYTLDSLLEELGVSVNMVRMDLEGYEVMAVKGMRRTLQEDGPIIVMELHPHLVGGDEICDLLMYFKSLGYEAECFVNRSMDFAWTRSLLPMRITIDEVVKDIRSGGESTFKLGEKCVTAFLIRR